MFLLRLNQKPIARLIARFIDHANLSKASIEEFEHAVATAKIPPKVFLKNQIFEDLKRLFGKDVEVLVSN